MNNIFDQLITLSLNLGRPENDYVILGEGNTSARQDEKTFWVKASGSHLGSIQPAGLVQVYFEPVLAMLNGPDLSDTAVKDGLIAAKVDPHAPGHPSVETSFHAACLQLPDVNFVGHTHPTAVNMLTCSAAFATALSGRLFPDEIVVCGVAPMLVPYVDPGLPLAREIRRRLYEYIDTYGERPKTVFLQNHGLIALATRRNRWKILRRWPSKPPASCAAPTPLAAQFYGPGPGGSHPHRPDEHYRQKGIGKL
jgi:rhamnose utilization protein RhaD (predicted bifunctional aldolase and dehydrogenase)